MYNVLAVFLHEYQYGKILGGVERRFVEIARRLPKYGIQMIAIEYPPSVGTALSANYRPITVERRRRGGTVGEALQLVRLSIWSIVWGKKVKCDLVYSPSGIYSQAIPAFLASFVLRKPLVIVFHSVPRGSHMGFTSAFKSQLIRRSPIKKALLKATIQALRRLAYERASVCFAVSRATAEQIQLTLAPRNLVVSGNGVGDEWFESEQIPKLYDACFVGRISPRKGVDLLLQAWGIVVRERHTAKLVLVGGGEDSSFVRYCKEIIKQLGIEDNVILAGFLDDNDLRRALSSSKLFVLPSKREGFGLAVVEAMARGVPCVLSELPSLKENFGDTAVLVDSPEAEEWAHSICQLLNDENLLSRLSQSGQAKAKRFSWDVVANLEASIILTSIESVIN